MHNQSNRVYMRCRAHTHATACMRCSAQMTDTDVPSDSQQLNCLRQGGLRASWDLKGEIRVFSPDRSLSREILFLSTNFLSAQSPFEDGIREVSFLLRFCSD